MKNQATEAWQFFWVLTGSFVGVCSMVYFGSKLIINKFTEVK